MKKLGIKFDLTKSQVELLGSLFDEITKCENAEEHGGILAQIFESTDGGFIYALVVDKETCKKIQSTTGVKQGKISTPGKEHIVWEV